MSQCVAPGGPTVLNQQVLRANKSDGEGDSASNISAVWLIRLVWLDHILKYLIETMDSRT